MLPPDDKRTNAREAARLIRRQIRYAENMRFLRRLPGFELDRQMPTEFLQLLGKLHQAEARGRPSGGEGG